MQEFIKNGNRTKNITLNGSECEVIFDSTYTVFSVKADSEVTVALESGKAAGDDGAMVCPAGESIMYPHMQRRDRLYITGSGNVSVFASNVVVNPFKKLAKGGDVKPKPGILPHSDGLTAYFDSSKNVSGTGWADTINGHKLNAPTIVNDDLSVSFSEAAEVGLDLTEAFTVYMLFKYTGTRTDWAEIFLAFSSTPRFSLFSHNNKIVIGSGTPSGGDIFPSVSSLDYHICTMVYSRGMGALHIDGEVVGRYNNYRVPVDAAYYLYPGNNFKMAAFFENVAHSPKYIAENSAFLAEKYGITI